MFLNILSKKNDFNLKLYDKDFELLINNSFFKNNEQIEIENLNILNYDLDYIKDHLNKYKIMNN